MKGAQDREFVIRRPSGTHRFQRTRAISSLGWLCARDPVEGRRSLTGRRRETGRRETESIKKKRKQTEPEASCADKKKGRRLYSGGHDDESGCQHVLIGGIYLYALKKKNRKEDKTRTQTKRRLYSLGYRLENTVFMCPLRQNVLTRGSAMVAWHLASPAVACLFLFRQL